MLACGPSCNGYEEHHHGDNRALNRVWDPSKRGRRAQPEAGPARHSPAQGVGGARIALPQRVVFLTPHQLLHLTALATPVSV